MSRTSLVVLIVAILLALALATWGGVWAGTSRVETMNEYAQAELASVKAELNKALSSIVSLQQDDTTVQTKLASTEAGLAQLQSQYSDLQQGHATLQSQLAAAEAELSQMQSRYWSVSYPYNYTYSLNVYVNPSGAGSVYPPDGQYASGTPVTLMATPAAGSTFAYWSGDASGSSPTTTITMSSNKSVTANFRSISYPDTYPNNFTYNFTVPGFGEVSLAGYLDATQSVSGSFVIVGTGFDIRFYVISPSGIRIIDTISPGNSFGFQGGESGTYRIYFENKSPQVRSAASSKAITLGLNIGGWQLLY